MVTGSYILNTMCEESWYLLPATLKSYENIFSSKFIDKINFESIEENNVASNPLIIVGNKAILNMEGTLLRKAGFLDAMCGVVGMDTLSNLFVSAINNPSVEHIILNWDSPGGSAIGTPEFANLVHSMRGAKRITSCISGSMCSAAYFIGAAAHEIYSTSLINSVGSIGVVTMHIDQSQADHNEGLKYTYIYSGKHKVDGNSHQPLSPEALAKIQNKLDYTYQIFLESVAMYRGVTVESISQYADGQVFNAGQLLNTPMLDGIATLDEIVRS